MDIQRCRIIETDCTDPYRNLAEEECLMKQAKDGELILFLWQNERTVVIGRNQNAWQECDVDRLRQDGGRIARRLSGGGAVYHDLGNLNFTFIAYKNLMDTHRQLEVIRRAVRSFGIRSEFTGRNDLTAEGRKFSGNAYYSDGKVRYHHGTILIRTDMERMKRYLTVSAEKLAAKGVASVESRVINLSELSPAVTAGTMRGALCDALEDVYGCRVEKLYPDILDPALWAEKTQQYASDLWIFGRSGPFNQKLVCRCPGGKLELRLWVENGLISDAQVYSDAMDPDWVDSVRNRLTGIRFLRSAIEEVTEGILTD